MTAYRNVQFTDFLNVENKLDFLLLSGEPIYPINYICFGVELCPTTGKLHLQGYVEFTKRMYMKGIKSLFKNDGLHLEKVINKDCLIKYNKKEGEFYEYGQLKKGSLFERLHTESVYDIIASNEQLASENVIPMRYFKEIIDNKRIEDKEKEFKDFFREITLSDYQLKIKSLLMEQNDRNVLWIYDLIGNNGKTWLSNHLLATEDCLILPNGSSRDLSCMYNGQKYIVFDFSRTVEERLNYQIIEDLKNGRIFSPKYKSMTKYCLGVKVVCLANFLPQIENLSLDRWAVWNTVQFEGNTILEQIDLNTLQTDRQTDSQSSYLDMYS